MLSGRTEVVQIDSKSWMLHCGMKVVGEDVVPVEAAAVADIGKNAKMIERYDLKGSLKREAILHHRR